MVAFYTILLGVITWHLTTPDHSLVGRLAGGLFVYAIGVVGAYQWAVHRARRCGHTHHRQPSDGSGRPPTRSDTLYSGEPADSPTINDDIGSNMFLSSTARLRRRVAHALVLITSHNPARGDAGNSDEDPAPIPSGGPFLHWVADRPDGLRLAGQYLPASMPPASQPVARQSRRRR